MRRQRQRQTHKHTNTHTNTMATFTTTRTKAIRQLFETMDEEAKSMKVRGKETKRRFMGVGQYYWKDIPQLDAFTKTIVDALIEEKDRDYKSALLILYEGGDSCGWHKDKKDEEFTNENVVMYNFGHRKGWNDDFQPTKETELGYIETDLPEGTGRLGWHDLYAEEIKITHDSRIEMKAYDIRHRAKTWKRYKQFSHRINITLRK